ncbi:MAG TPA: D-arabinono-1,4-lactone oxidase, partial [Candidatus Limnocylindrales bacterium]|nr:D-arabinono-1,4-lactone oxidase [Candidatus Limnocylindrales bacterium]
ASAAVGLELVRADGELERIGDGDDRLPGAVVGLGTLGIVTALTLAVEPAFRMRQDVYEGLPFATAIDRLDEILSSADAVSLFTDWSEPGFHQVWVKRRVQAGDEHPGPLDLRPPALAQTSPATAARHPIRGMSAVSCTPQLGEVGPWHERLPHFRLDHQPSAGDELQSEFIVRRQDGAAALDALAALHDQLAPLTLVTEIRSIAADDQWLSPAFGRDSISFHFTWRPDWPSVREALPAIEGALEPFGLRPHWGKLFTVRPERVRDAYPMRPAFVELARSFDPERRFSNRFLETYLFGED